MKDVCIHGEESLEIRVIELLKIRDFVKQEFLLIVIKGFMIYALAEV